MPFEFIIIDFSFVYEKRNGNFPIRLVTLLIFKNINSISVTGFEQRYMFFNVCIVLSTSNDYYSCGRNVTRLKYDIYVGEHLNAVSAFSKQGAILSNLLKMFLCSLKNMFPHIVHS